MDADLASTATTLMAINVPTGVYYVRLCDQWVRRERGVERVRGECSTGGVHVCGAFDNGITVSASASTITPGDCDFGPGGGERRIDLVASAPSYTWSITEPSFFAVSDGGGPSRSGSGFVLMRAAERNRTGATRTATF